MQARACHAQSPQILPVTWISLISLSLISYLSFAQKSDPRRYVGKDAQIAMKDLVFEDEVDAARWRRLYACQSSRSDQTWEAYPLREIGAFATIDACKGERVVRGCSGGGFRSRAGSQWWSLSTLHHSDGPFFGYVVSGGINPVSDGVGVSIWRGERGKRIVGERLLVEFALWRAGQVETRLSIGDELSYTIKQTTMSVPVAETREQLIRGLTASPARLLALGLAQLMALQKEVTATLNSDKVLKCVYGPYEGGGIPPVCVKRVPLDERERARELKRVEIMFSAQRALIERHAPELHAQLLKVFPQSCLLH